MIHSFDVNIAKKYGVHEAILLNHLNFWIEKNRANDRHYYDGYYWTYSTKKAFAELFPYLTERQVGYVLEKLVDAGLLMKGNYNKSSYDRTLWYAITKKGYSIIQNCQMKETNLSNQSDEIVQPIPDILPDNITDNKTDINHINGQTGLDRPPNEGKKKKNDNWKKQFEKFYSQYPKKVKKQNVRKWFEKNRPDDELFLSMLKSLDLFKKSNEWTENKGQFIPYPSTWLNQRRWEDEGLTAEKTDIVEYKEIRTDNITDEEYRKLIRGG